MREMHLAGFWSDSGETVAIGSLVATNCGSEVLTGDFFDPEKFTTFWRKLS
jgi:hypothetical protein